MNTNHTVDIFGIEVSSLRMDQLLDVCVKNIQSKKNMLLGVLNVAKAVNCQKNTKLRQSLEQADLIVADGLPLVWLSKLIGKPLPERVAGIDIMLELLQLASRKNYKVYLLGARKEIIEKVAQIFQDTYPGVCITGYRDGYFTEEEEYEVAKSIKEASTDILFVAMTSPKKENFLGKWREYINVSVCHGVGGSFDVVAGITKRAPLWMQKCGLEWLYRVIQEPRRMWKRYLVTNIQFFRLAFVEIIRSRIQNGV